MANPRGRRDRLFDRRELFASVLLSGRIVTAGDPTPRAIHIARGQAALVRGLIERYARCAYGDAVWMVPCMPEARDDSDALEALCQFVSDLCTAAPFGMNIVDPYHAELQYQLLRLE